MDNFDQTLKTEMDSLTLVVNFGIQMGWITKNEQLRIEKKATLDFKKLAFFEILTNTKCDENAARLLFALRCITEMKLDPYDNTPPQHYLSRIMSKLHTHCLVTEEQKLIYESIQRENRTMINSVQKERLENGKEKTGAAQGDIDTMQIRDIKRNPCENSTNPMLIALVMKCFLQYLNIEEVKNARRISKVWSSVGLNVLKNRSKVEFSQDIHSDSTYRSPQNFFSIFPADTVPFTSYRFFGYDISTPWAIDKLNLFFRNQQKHIKELDFDKVHLVDENKFPISRYDISSWLLNSAMTKSNTKYNTKFEVSGYPTYHNDNEGSTMIFVQLTALVNIKELRLLDCGIDLQEGIVIRPTKIQMADVFFYQNGNMLTEICVNDIVDFSKAKEVDLTYSSFNWQTKATKLILEMDRNADIRLESLSLKYVTLNNLGACTWNVKQLYLENTPFTESSEMQIEELDIFSSRVDISALPQSLEKLTISPINTTNCVCSQPTVLHNLKVMKLGFKGSQIQEFLHSQIFKCPSLVELHLENNSARFSEIKLTWIPQTLKILKLKSIFITGQEMDNNLHLDKLVLSQYGVAKDGEVHFTHIPTTNLVLSFSYNFVHNVDSFLSILHNQNICRGSDQRIYAGPFSWTAYSETMFEESPLRGYVDRKAEYYLFENKIGKAIDVEEFRMIMACSYD